MAFLLGLTTTSRRTGTLFSVSSPTQSRVAHYFLLVVVEEEESNGVHAVQDKLENTVQQFIPITAMVLLARQFQDWLREGHPFAAQVCHKSLLLYQKELLPLPVAWPGKEEERHKETEALYAQAKTAVEALLAGADLYRLRKEYRFAAFMLHQSTEQALRTLVIAGTGYSPNTHSLDRLLRYATLVSHSVPDLFPQRTEKDKRLHRLLQRAYIDSRYQDYTISDQDLALLTERVKTLHDLLSEFGKTPSPPHPQPPHGEGTQGEIKTSSETHCV